jgi:hypothetical protein
MAASLERSSQEEASADHGSAGQPSHSAQGSVGLSIRDIRMAMNQTQKKDHYSPPQSLAPSTMSFHAKAAPRKKSSLFGSIFTIKEPTQDALNQVAAQMIAQHGSTSATRVPNVRMEKMPQHVPKVNAKWDGVPEAVKRREKRDKERVRTANRQSLTASTYRSRSSERTDWRTDSRASNISDDSRDSRARSAHSSSRRHELYNPNPHRFYAQSVNSSGDLAAQLRPEEVSEPSSVASPPPSVKSASSKSLTDPGIFQEDIPPPPAIPEEHLRETKYGKQPRKVLSPIAPPADAVPDHTGSPRPTPRDRSPITPLHSGNQRNGKGVVLTSAGADVLPLPMITRSGPAVPVPSAFLAGEAREFTLPDDDSDSVRSYCIVQPSSINRLSGVEKRPDSSRDRLGLNSSLVKDERPWTARHDGRHDGHPQRPASANDHTNAQLKPKSTISRAFGTFLKREL